VYGDRHKQHGSREIHRAEWPKRRLTAEHQTPSPDEDARDEECERRVSIYGQGMAVDGA
jgi:hypothetical protein